MAQRNCYYHGELAAQQSLQFWEAEQREFREITIRKKQCEVAINLAESWCRYYVDCYFEMFEDPHNLGSAERRGELIDSNNSGPEFPVLQGAVKEAQRKMAAVKTERATDQSPYPAQDSLDEREGELGVHRRGGINE